MRKNEYQEGDILRHKLTGESMIVAEKDAWGMLHMRTKDMLLFWFDPKEFYRVPEDNNRVVFHE